MIRSGMPETVVMAVTGHSTRAMLDRYRDVRSKRGGTRTRLSVPCTENQRGPEAQPV